MMLNIPLVQLKHELSGRNQSFILGSSVRALAIEQPLIPAAARFDVANRDERLCAHKSLARVAGCVHLLLHCGRNVAMCRVTGVGRQRASLSGSSAHGSPIIFREPKPVLKTPTK